MVAETLSQSPSRLLPRVHRTGIRRQHFRTAQPQFRSGDRLVGSGALASWHPDWSLAPLRGWLGFVDPSIRDSFWVLRWFSLLCSVFFEFSAFRWELFGGPWETELCGWGERAPACKGQQQAAQHAQRTRTETQQTTRFRRSFVSSTHPRGGGGFEILPFPLPRDPP